MIGLMRHRERQRPLVALAVALGLVVGACGGGDAGPLDIGIRRFALDLAFEDEELAVPVKPETIIRAVPAPPEVQAPADLERFRRRPDAPVQPPALPGGFTLPECAEPPTGAAPVEAVSVDVNEPPSVGTYPRHNEGTIDITGGPFPITLPYPPISKWEIPAIEEVTDEGLAASDVTYQEYEVHKIVTESFRVTDRFRLNHEEGKIQLMRRTTVTAGGETVFEPSPPIDFYVFGVEGDSWSSAGVDDARGTAMLFEGTIERREVVDLCGEVVDTYRMVASERMVNLETGETSGTSDDDPNVYNVAPHLGGMIVREDINMTFTTRDAETGSPLVVELVYVSTLDAFEPEPLRP